MHVCVNAIAFFLIALQALVRDDVMNWLAAEKTDQSLLNITDSHHTSVFPCLCSGVDPRQRRRFGH